MDRPAPLAVREVALELRCSEDEVRALIREGELQTVASGSDPASFRATGWTTEIGYQVDQAVAGTRRAGPVSRPRRTPFAVRSCR